MASDPETGNRKYYEGQLHALLAKHAPEYVHIGRIEVPRLAAAIGRSPRTVANWLLSDRLPRDGAVKICAITNRRVTLADLIPFVLADQ